MAKIYGLPVKNITWTKILRAKFEFGRRVTAMRLLMDEDSTWSEISKVLIKQDDQVSENSVMTIMIAIAVGAQLAYSPRDTWGNIIRSFQYFGIVV